MTARHDLRNVAIIAHVDHGKTTLVDALLWQSGAFRANQDVNERVMDSNDLEREKGITILAKNTAVKYGDVTLNIVDTPGHADFGGEVERALAMVDGVLLLVDASEGPLPQTRFVLRKTLEAHLPVILVVNKVDRPDARIAEVVDEVYELFIDLGADEHQIEFPIVYANARAGWASLDADVEGSDLKPLCELILERIPAPEYEEGHPFQALVTNLDASPYLGRLALCRVRNGHVRKGEQVAWCRIDGTIERVKIVELYLTDALDRVPAERRRARRHHRGRGNPGDHDRRDARRPRRPATAAATDRRRAEPLDDRRHQHVGRSPVRTARSSPPARSRTGCSKSSSATSPCACSRPSVPTRGRCRDAASSSSRSWSRRCAAKDSSSPSASRRSSLREMDGKLHEPVELLTVDVPEDYLGVVTQLLALRKGRMEQMVNHGTGWVRIDFRVAARGLIGFRTEFLTETRGTGMLHHVFDGWEPWFGELRTRPTGSLVADRRGMTTGYALMNLQERGAMLVGPGVEVYEGMIVGENARADEMDVNPTKEKQLTNHRAVGLRRPGATGSRRG